MTIGYGEIIRQRRMEYGMTQKELADAACVSRQYVIAVENDHRSGGMDLFLSVLDALDLKFEIVEVNK